ncbi:MAG: hypothetical protein KDD62_04925 [Bdellovibrionales bacterium]|nr:hypothetical protein [Bdellovibrionales bacterium]
MFAARHTPIAPSQAIEPESSIYRPNYPSLEVTSKNGQIISFVSELSLPEIAKITYVDGMERDSEIKGRVFANVEITDSSGYTARFTKLPLRLASAEKSAAANEIPAGDARILSLVV